MGRFVASGKLLSVLHPLAQSTQSAHACSTHAELGIGRTPGQYASTTTRRSVENSPSHAAAWLDLADAPIELWVALPVFVVASSLAR